MLHQHRRALDDDGLAEINGEIELCAERSGLRDARCGVVFGETEIVESSFTDGDDTWGGRYFTERREKIGALVGDVVRMDAGGGPDLRVIFCE